MFKGNGSCTKEELYSDATQTLQQWLFKLSWSKHWRVYGGDDWGKIIRLNACKILVELFVVMFRREIQTPLINKARSPWLEYLGNAGFNENIFREMRIAQSMIVAKILIYSLTGTPWLQEIFETPCGLSTALNYGSLLMTQNSSDDHNTRPVMWVAKGLWGKP